jgi:hypothetical protein
MRLRKRRFAALLWTVLFLSAGLWLRSALAGESPATVSDSDLTVRVDQRVKAWEPTREERRFDEIGWARDIRGAERLAAQYGRPVFLFTHDGRMATGRC